MIADETAVFIMSVFRRRVYERIGPFDETLRTNEDYDFWVRAAWHGFVFWRNDTPLGHYRRREDSLSFDELRMLPGILKVFHKLRPQLVNHPLENAILDAQVARFEIEYMAAEVRGAIEARDYAAAGHHLSNLRRRRGGALLKFAELMARWTPTLLSMAYHNRRTRILLSKAYNTRRTRVALSRTVGT
jgi:hypothetical protein